MTKKLSAVFGIIFILIGILSFVKNPLFGPTSFFATNIPHDILYIIIGIVLCITASKTAKTASLVLKIFGIFFLILFLDGLIQLPLLGFLASNMAHNYLNLIFGIGMLI